MAITFDTERDRTHSLTRGIIIRYTAGAWGATDYSNSHTFNYFVIGGGSGGFSVNDALYVYYGRFNPYRGDGRWHNPKFYVGTARTSAGGGVWEYWNNTAWVALACTDNTNGFTTVGANTVEFTPPADWQERNLNEQQSGGPAWLNIFGYYIRYRLTDITGIVAGGAQSTQRVTFRDYGIQVVGTNSAAGYIFADLYAESDSEGWNMVEQFDKDGSGNYRFFYVKCNLYIGDNSTETFFRMQDNVIFFDGQMVCTNNSTVKIGILDGNEPKQGCTLAFRNMEDNNRYYSPRFGAEDATIELADTKFMEYHYLDLGNSTSGTTTAKACVFGNTTVQHQGNLVLNRITYSNIAEGFRVSGPSITANDITLYNSDRGIMLGWVGGFECSVNNLKLIRVSNNHAYFTNTYNNTGLNVIDAEGFDSNLITTGGAIGTNNWVKEIYSVVLKIVDKDANPIENAIITVTNDNGDEFSDTSDSSGEALVQPVIAYTVIATGSVTTNYYNPINLKISKNGYKTYKSKFALSEKKDMIIMLQHNINPGRNEMGEEFR